MAQQNILVWMFRFTESLLIESELSPSVTNSKTGGKCTHMDPLSSDWHWREAVEV